MFRWNMSMETGNDGIDHARRALLEAMADFFQILDARDLNQHLVAERTGQIFNAMKTAFTTENEVLKAHPSEASDHHIASHAAYQLAYVDLCRKVVPKIKTQKQAQQICLEIYRMIDDGIFQHLKAEALDYRHLTKKA